MLRVLIHCSQLLFLSQVWPVIYGISDATVDVVATCNEDVLLPCHVVQDPQVTYKEISWYKGNEKGEELLKMEWKKLQYNKEDDYSGELNSSLAVSSSEWYSLKIKNTTNHNSGRYKCILETSDRKYNRSSTITLTVEGCPEQSEETTFQKHRAELVLLCSFGLFYLLLIFFTCTCLKEEGSRDFHKSRKRHVPTRLNSTYQKNDSNGTDEGNLNQHSLPVDFLQSVEIDQ